MALAEVSVIPVGTRTSSVSKYIAQAVKILEEERNIKYEITAMGTIIEGDLEQLFSLILKMHRAVLDARVVRVVTTVKIDDRRDKSSSIDNKIKSLKKKLGH